jgi:hypothetical protein
MEARCGAEAFVVVKLPIMDLAMLYKEWPDVVRVRREGRWWFIVRQVKCRGRLCARRAYPPGSICSPIASCPTTGSWSCGRGPMRICPGGFRGSATDKNQAKCEDLGTCYGAWASPVLMS